MYSLKVLKNLSHPDGREFAVGHNANSLSVFEVAELVIDYPDYFEAADEITADTIKNTDNMKHYADAAKKLHAEKSQGTLSKVKK